MCQWFSAISGDKWRLNFSSLLPDFPRYHPFRRPLPLFLGPRSRKTPRECGRNIYTRFSFGRPHFLGWVPVIGRWSIGRGAYGPEPGGWPLWVLGPRAPRLQARQGLSVLETPPAPPLHASPPSRPHRPGRIREPLGPAARPLATPLRGLRPRLPACPSSERVQRLFPTMPVGNILVLYSSPYTCNHHCRLVALVEHYKEHYRHYESTGAGMVHRMEKGGRRLEGLKKVRALRPGLGLALVGTARPGLPASVHAHHLGVLLPQDVCRVAVGLLGSPAPQPATAP